MSNLVKQLRPRTWRTRATHEQYETDRVKDVACDRCPLCDATTLQQFTHWRIINNKYPHDAIADVHHMVVPNEHKLEKELDDAERQELYDLKYSHLCEHYNFLTEALPGSKSVPGHFHLHFIVPKTIDA